jgi:hypothetical protein
MKTRLFNCHEIGLALLIILCASVPALAQAACSMQPVFSFPDKGPKARIVRGSADGALLYDGPLEINFDGAPNAYHPLGGSAGALDTVCNAANVVLPDGSKIRGDTACGAFLEKFKEARESGWIAPGKPHVEWYGIATQGDKGDSRYKPCIQTAGPFEGFFVSQTALIADPTKQSCDSDRYLNSAKIPFFVLPKGSRFLARGMRQGDVGVAADSRTGRVVSAVFADTGPRDKLGEGSLALGLSLQGRPLNPKPSRAQAQAAAIASGVWVLMFPGSDIKPPYTSERIAEAGQERLKAWGGQERLKECMSVPP